MLFVPSLVNRAYVLDLAPGHSMLRWLAANGVRPLLLDWGWPGEAERRFTLTDYVAGRLERAMAAARDLAGGPVVLAGYCMGGTLAVAAAQRRPDLVRALALLAAPWDFHAPDPDRAKQAAAMLPLVEPALAFNHTLPVDLLQVLFAMLDPWGVADKYRGFARLDPDSERARLFVALEDWLNDGVPLAAPVARECLAGWYGENTPARGDMADRRAAGRSGGAAAADVRRRAGARPDRAAGIRAPAGRADRRRGAARTRGRAYRHGRGAYGRTCAVAAVAGLAAAVITGGVSFRHRSIALSRHAGLASSCGFRVIARSAATKQPRSTVAPTMRARSRPSLLRRCAPRDDTSQVPDAAQRRLGNPGSGPR